MILRIMLSFLLMLVAGTTASADPQGEIRTLFTPYDDPEHLCLSLIGNANREILVAAYALTDSNLVDALINASRRGVVVKLIVDKTQSGGKKQKILIRQLIASGVTLKVGTSPVKSALLHCKFLVVDQHLVFSGSWNFTGATASNQFNEVDLIDSSIRAALFEQAWNKIYSSIK